MNQGIPFARTLRALDAGDFRISKLGLLLAAAVLSAWFWWAFAARVPQYEISATAHVDSTGQNAVAYFHSARVGQHAILRSNGVTIEAVVTAVSETNGGQIHANLQPLQTAHLTEPLSAELEVERVSPALIVLRAAGFNNP